MAHQASTWVSYLMTLYFSFVGVRCVSAVTYGVVGGTVVLSPIHPVTPVTSVTWKIEPDLAMEWHGKELDAWRQFQDRGTLNTTSGQMTITGLTLADSGHYSVSVNDKSVTNIELKVIGTVSKPSVSVTCDDMHTCLLTCDGTRAGAEPVRLFWEIDGKVVNLTRGITLTEENRGQSYACAFENPVSHLKSDPVQNPFNRNHLILIVVLFLYLTTVIVISFLSYRAYKKPFEGTSSPPNIY